MDVLTDLLQRSRASGAAFSSTTAYGDWGLAFPGGETALAVHALVDGEAHLWPADAPGDARRLLAGDIVLVREATAHNLAHAPGATCTPMSEIASAGTGVSRRATLGERTGAPAAAFFCGAYRFEGDLCRGLLEALPDTVHARPAAGSTLRVTLELMAREILDARAGQQAVLDRLLDVALVHILRDHFADGMREAPGWFQASQDPQLGEALRALHADPAHPWTVAELAEHALLSRSAFARRFTGVVGASPLAYLHDWRMALARERLRDSDARLAEIGAQVGYASEFAFAAAFKRQHGVAPGQWRRTIAPGIG